MMAYDSAMKVYVLSSIERQVWKNSHLLVVIKEGHMKENVSTRPDLKDDELGKTMKDREHDQEACAMV
jgi:hypothetical protein